MKTEIECLCGASLQIVMVRVFAAERVTYMVQACSACEEENYARGAEDSKTAEAREQDAQLPSLEDVRGIFKEVKGEDA